MHNVAGSSPVQNRKRRLLAESIRDFCPDGQLHGGIQRHLGDAERDAGVSAAFAEDFNEELGLLLYDVFDPARRSRERNVAPGAVFFEARVVNGRMDCHPERMRLVRAAEKEAG